MTYRIRAIVMICIAVLLFASCANPTPSTPASDSATSALGSLAEKPTEDATADDADEKEHSQSEAQTDTSVDTDTQPETAGDSDTALDKETEAETEAELAFSFEVLDSYSVLAYSNNLKAQLLTFYVEVKTTCLSGKYEGDLHCTGSHTCTLSTELNQFLARDPLSSWDTLLKEDDNSGDNGPGALVDLILPTGNVIRLTPTSPEMIIGPEGDWITPPDYSVMTYKAGESKTYRWECTLFIEDPENDKTLAGWNFADEGPYTLRLYLMGQERIVEGVYFSPRSSS